MTTNEQKLEKIDSQIAKMSIPEQLDLWRLIGDRIHQRIEDHKKQKQQEIDNLDSLQKEIK